LVALNHLTVPVVAMCGPTSVTKQAFTIKQEAVRHDLLRPGPMLKSWML
jgi:hypothetical protein